MGPTASPLPLVAQRESHPCAVSLSRVARRASQTRMTTSRTIKLATVWGGVTALVGFAVAFLFFLQPWRGCPEGDSPTGCATFPVDSIVDVRGCRVNGGAAFSGGDIDGQPSKQCHRDCGGHQCAELGRSFLALEGALSFGLVLLTGGSGTPCVHLASSRRVSRPSVKDGRSQPGRGARSGQLTFGLSAEEGTDMEGG